ITLPLVQYLIETLGWRAAYEAVGLAILALLPLCLLLPWRRLEGRDRRNDRPAAPAVGTGSRPSASVDWTLGRAMRSAPYWRLVQVFFFTSVAIYCVSPQIVAFLIESGFSPISAASAFGFAGLLSTGGMIVTGRLADRIGFDRAALLSFGLTATGVVG